MKRKLINLLSKSVINRLKGKVLYYHSIGKMDRSLNPKTFQQHIEYLISKNYKFLTASQFGKKLLDNSLNKKSICITFDDGYMDNYTNVFLQLKDKSIPFTIFVATDFIGSNQAGNNLYNNREFLNMEQLSEMSQYGIEIASHTCNHKNLVKLSSEEIDSEMKESKQKLELVINSPVNSFSYPNGQRGSFNKLTRKKLIESGYKYGFTTMYGIPLFSNIDIFTIPRILIASSDVLSIFKDKLNGKYDILAYYYQLINGSKQWE